MPALNVTCAPLPSNFRGTPQELIEAFLDRLKIVSNSTEFVISDTQPEGNQGPWLKNGKQWYVWDEETSTYVPLDISESFTPQIATGETAPDSSEYSLWLKTSGTTVVGLFFYMGEEAGWVQRPNELGNNVITEAMLQANSVTRDKIKNGEVTHAKIQNDLPLTKLERGAAFKIVRMNSNASAPTYSDQTYESAPLTFTGTVTKLEVEHGLPSPPRNIRYVAVCVEAQYGWEEGDEVTPDTIQKTYVKGDKVGAIVGAVPVRSYSSPGTDANPASPSKWKVKLYWQP